MKKIVLFLLLALIVVSCDTNQKKPPLAKNGVLDLRGWNFEKDGPVALNGEWEFYWNKHLKYFDFYSKNPIKMSAYMKVPGYWDEDASAGKEFPKTGYATYRLIIKLPEKYKDYGIWFKNDYQTSAITLFSGGKKILFTGLHGRDKNIFLPGASFNLYSQISSNDQRIELIINASYRWEYTLKGGLHYNHFLFGPHHIVKNNMDIEDIVQILIFGCILMACFYFFFVYLIRKTEKVALYFSIYCFLLFICYFILEGFYGKIFPDPDRVTIIIAYFIVFMTFFAYFNFLFLFIYKLYSEEYGRKIIKIQTFFTIIIFLPIFFVDLDFFNIFSQIFRVFFFISIIYLYIVIIKALKKKRVGALIILLGCTIYIITTISDAIYYTGLYPVGFSTIIYGVFLFALSQTVVLSKRYATAFQTVEIQAIELLEHKEHLEELVEERTFELKNEKSKSDKLLLNVLPEQIATRLKQGETPIADHFEEASVIFIDIADFTKLSARSKPQEMVKMLNDIFTIFDKISAKYGLEKIKTIGDCYMAAAGIPVPREDHAEAVAKMAVEVMDTMKDYKVKLSESSELSESWRTIQFRIGLDCGPIVAGVIGEQKFIYDLWGDMVNTASRMETHGIIGKIQCTGRFKNKLSESSELSESYRLEERGEIEIKGKGMMKTYFLVDRR